MLLSRLRNDDAAEGRLTDVSRGFEPGSAIDERFVVLLLEIHECLEAVTDDCHVALCFLVAQCEFLDGLELFDGVVSDEGFAVGSGSDLVQQCLRHVLLEECESLTLASPAIVLTLCVGLDFLSEDNLGFRLMLCELVCGFCSSLLEDCLGWFLWFEIALFHSLQCHADVFGVKPQFGEDGTAISNTHEVDPSRSLADFPDFVDPPSRVPSLVDPPSPNPPSLAATGYPAGVADTGNFVMAGSGGVPANPLEDVSTEFTLPDGIWGLPDGETNGRNEVLPGEDSEMGTNSLPSWDCRMGDCCLAYVGGERNGSILSYRILSSPWTERLESLSGEGDRVLFASRMNWNLRPPNPGSHSSFNLPKPEENGELVSIDNSSLFFPSTCSGTRQNLPHRPSEQGKASVRQGSRCKPKLEVSALSGQCGL